MKRSPGPDALLAVDHEEDDVGVGQLALDPALHPLGEDVARALHAGKVDEDELALGLEVGGDAADRPARRLRPAGDDRDVGADEGVDQGRLADVGPAGEPDEAGACHRSPANTSRLQRQHLAVVGLVVVAAEVEDAVDGGLGDVGAVLGADRDVAELARAGDRAAVRRSERRARRWARPCRGARG